MEIKRLEVIVAEARSEVSKAEEALEELARHAAFLDAITPAHHFQVIHGLHVIVTALCPDTCIYPSRDGHIKSICAESHDS